MPETARSPDFWCSLPGFRKLPPAKISFFGKNISWRLSKPDTEESAPHNIPVESETKSFSLKSPCYTNFWLQPHNKDRRSFRRFFPGLQATTLLQLTPVSQPLLKQAPTLQASQKHHNTRLSQVKVALGVPMLV